MNVALSLQAHGYAGIAAVRDSNHPALFVRKSKFEILQSATLAVTLGVHEFMMDINAPGGTSFWLATRFSGEVLPWPLH